MEKHHSEQLSSILRMYGSYEVVKEISKQTISLAKEHYADNSDAVIHGDSRAIEKCVGEMKASHFLRALD